MGQLMTRFQSICMMCQSSQPNLTSRNALLIWFVVSGTIYIKTQNSPICCTKNVCSICYLSFAVSPPQMELVLECKYQVAIGGRWLAANCSSIFVGCHFFWHFLSFFFCCELESRFEASMKKLQMEVVVSKLHALFGVMFYFYKWDCYCSEKGLILLQLAAGGHFSCIICLMSSCATKVSFLQKGSGCCLPVNVFHYIHKKIIQLICSS